MDYIDWNNITEEIDLDFLQPLLDQVSQIYKDQWENAQSTIISSDPYGSSIREENIADAFENYNAQSAQQQSDILTQYHGALMNNSMKNQLEKMQEKYEQMMQEYEDYKTEHEESQDAPMPLEYYLNMLNQPTHQGQQNTPTQTVQTQQQQQFQPWPPPGIILNPEMLTEYHPFDEPTGWGELPSQFQPSGQEGIWWDQGNQQPWWDKNNRKTAGIKSSGKPGKYNKNWLDAPLYRMLNSPTMRDKIMEHINYYYGDQVPNINLLMQEDFNPALLGQIKGKKGKNVKNADYVGKTGIPPTKPNFQQVKTGQNIGFQPRNTGKKKLNPGKPQYSMENLIPRPPRPGMKPKQTPMQNKKIRKRGYR